MKVFAWHGQTDPLPRFLREGNGATAVELRLQVGVDVNLDPGDGTAADPGDDPYTQPSAPLPAWSNLTTLKLLKR